MLKQFHYLGVAADFLRRYDHFALHGLADNVAQHLASAPHADAEQPPRHEYATEADYHETTQEVDEANDAYDALQVTSQQQQQQLQQRPQRDRRSSR